MTLQEVIQAANGGDITAMYTLGDYYFDQHEWSNAWKWLSMAADQGHINAAVESLLIGDKLAHYYEALPDYEMAYQCWAKCFRYIGRVAKVPNKTEDLENLIIGKYPDIVYGICYTLYCKKDYQKAREFLEGMIDPNSEKRMSVLLGLCYGKMGDLEKAYPYLALIEEHEIEFGQDALKFLAYTYLSLIYRTSDTHRNIEASYHCTLMAAQLPGAMGEAARDELKHYYKNELGNYAYQE